MKEQIWECWVHHFELKRGVRPHSEFVSLMEKILRHVHRTFVPGRRDPWRCAQTRENRVGTQVLCSSLIQRERERKRIEFFLSIAKSAISLNCWLIKLLEEQSCSFKMLILLLEEQKDYLLSEARSEPDMHALRVASADRAVQESGPQLHSQMMELYQAKQLSDHSKRESEQLAMHRIGQERKSSSRGLYDIQKERKNYIRDFLELLADQAAQTEKVALSRLSEAKDKNRGPFKFET